MKKSEKKEMIGGIAFIMLFTVWTVLIKTVDVRPLGQNGTDIGFASFNLWFYRKTGVRMWLYAVTDRLELAAIAICLSFGILGLIQLIKRKKLIKVDKDIIILGVYYLVVIVAYLIFDKIPINYRPVLIDGSMEASYPSSTTLLVMSVTLALVEQIDRRIKHNTVKRLLQMISAIFMGLMVTGRLLSGVHWFTDIIGAVLLSIGMFLIYKGFADTCITMGKGGEADGIS